MTDRWQALLEDLRERWHLQEVEVELLSDPALLPLLRKVLAVLREDSLQDLLRADSLEGVFRRQGEVAAYEKAVSYFRELVEAVDDNDEVSKID